MAFDVRVVSATVRFYMPGGLTDTQVYKWDNLNDQLTWSLNQKMYPCQVVSQVTRPVLARHWRRQKLADAKARAKIALMLKQHLKAA